MQSTLTRFECKLFPKLADQYSDELLSSVYVELKCWNHKQDKDMYYVVICF